MNRTPSFPTVNDLPALHQDDAKAALAELRRLVGIGLADVYTRPYTPNGERPRWNFWFDRRVWPVAYQCMELPTWAAEWAAAHNDPTGGDAA